MTIPLLPGPWKRLSPGHAAGFARRLSVLLGQPRTHDALAAHHTVSGLRAMPLSFYPGWALIEGEAAVGAGLVGTFDVLYGPGLMWVIDGDSQVLHDLNAGRVPTDLDAYRDGAIGEALTPSSGAAGAPNDHAPGSDFIASPLAPLDLERSGPDYLRFFCGCVWGEEGPFMPVESADSPALVGAEPGAWRDALHPMRVEKSGDDLIGEVVIVYGRSLFEARLRLSGGAVTMEDDSPIASDLLPARRNLAPLRDLRSPAED